MTRTSLLMRGQSRTDGTILYTYSHTANGSEGYPSGTFRNLKDHKIVL